MSVGGRWVNVPGVVLFVLFGIALHAAAVAAPLAKPTGPVILTVTGAIAETNAPGRAEFDQAMLQALGTDEVRTSTEWTEGQPLFEGVRFSKLLDAVGAKGTTVLARALNDYSGEIAVDDLRKYPVLLALRINGAALHPDKAPIWIIYPRDDYPALKERDDLLWAWQLATIDVR